MEGVIGTDLTEVTSVVRLVSAQHHPAPPLGTPGMQWDLHNPIKRIGNHYTSWYGNFINIHTGY